MSTTTPASTTAIIATVEALTTEFVAPSTCYSKQLSILSSPGWEIWLNEPQPVPGTLYPNCYPSQFIDGYTSVYNKSSSIAPMMSPLVAPENWVTAKEMDNGYIALCPTGFQLTNPKTTVDTNRPAYGGTCYSDLTSGDVLTLSGFDSQGFTGTLPLTITSGMQAYAHVIEGKKASSTATNTAASGTGATTTTPTSSPVAVTSSASTDSSSSSSNSSSGISGGAIAGAVVGSVAGLVLIVLAIFFLFRRRKQTAATKGDHENSPETGAAAAYQDNNAYHNGDKALPAVPPEGTDSPASPWNQAPPTYQNHVELPDQNYNAAELESPQGPHSHLRELDAGYQGSELQNSGQNHEHPRS